MSMGSKTAKLYVSFGQKYNLHDALMEFVGMSDDSIRQYMHERYQDRYAFIYVEEEAGRQIKEYGLRIVLPGAPLFERY